MDLVVYVDDTLHLGLFSTTSLTYRYAYQHEQDKITLIHRFDNLTPLCKSLVEISFPVSWIDSPASLTG